MSGARRQGVGQPARTPADDKSLPKRRWWLFPVVAGGLTALWLILCLPYKEDTYGEVMPYTTKRAGWPEYFARWSVANDTKVTTYSAFFTGALLGDLAVLAAPIIVAWVIIRHVNGQPEEDTGRQRGATSSSPSSRSSPSPRPAPPPRPYPPRGPSQSSGGWG